MHAHVQYVGIQLFSHKIEVLSQLLTTVYQLSGRTESLEVSPPNTHTVLLAGLLSKALQTIIYSNSAGFKWVTPPLIGLRLVFVTLTCKGAACLV